MTTLLSMDIFCFNFQGTYISISYQVIVIICLSVISYLVYCCYQQKYGATTKMQNDIHYSVEGLHVTYMSFLLFLLMPAVLPVVSSMQHRCSSYIVRGYFSNRFSKQMFKYSVMFPQRLQVELLPSIWSH